PALSELEEPAFQPRTGRGLERRGIRVLMSLVAQGRHYIRDGEGVEQLYDLERDPFERRNAIESPEGQQAVGAFRRMLLDVLTADPGSIEVEGTYLRSYRQRLRSVVERSSSPRDAMTALRGRSDE